MMSEVRALSTEGEFAAFADVVIDAYPGVKERSGEARERLTQKLLGLDEKEPTISFWGLFREGQLRGGMRLFDFRMNFLQSQIPAGGVGQVAVELEHKKEHVAKELMLFYLRRCRERGVPLALLYPFRPDFYRAMGFGYGTKMSQYRLDPAALPEGRSKSHVRRLRQDDREALRACYARYAERTHGMIHKSEHDLDRLFESPRRRIVGYERDGDLRGYLAFTFERGENFLLNDLHVVEFIYETREALSELLAFLRTQADQVRRIVLRTQDASFHHLFDDPRNGSDLLISPVYHPTDVQGVGLMYRVVNVPRMFHLLRERNFGGQTCRLKLTIGDAFLPENAGSTWVSFEGGRARVVGDGAHDVAVEMDVASFSSLLAGTVSFERLYTYGRAEISEPAHVDTVNRLFAVDRKPICTTPF